MAETEVRVGLTDGDPVIVVENGYWHYDRLWVMRWVEQDIMSVARQKGMRRIDEIDTVVSERNGSLSVFQKEQPKMGKQGGYCVSAELTNTGGRDGPKS